FDPLAWLAARRMRIERELAADDRVLDDGARASSYAEHLLSLATTRPVPTGALAIAEPSQLGRRIRALLTPHARGPLGRGRFALAAAGLGVAVLVACATPEREAAPTVEVTPTVATTAPRPATTTIDPGLQQIV